MADPLDLSALERARTLVDAAEERSARLRLFGGAAVGLRCPSARRLPLARAYGDLDFMARADQREAVIAAFESCGYHADRHFNAMQGARRLAFASADGEPIDVFLDTFRMCHTLVLSDRLELEAYTLPLADLLMTKLQVVELTAKDVTDTLALLIDHDLVGPGGGEGIEVDRVQHVTGRDWGWYRTLCQNLERVGARAAELLGAAEAEVVRDRVARLRAAMDEAPKSRRWRLRAKVGDRVAWYELPEDRA
jgi:hypothetical protein